MLTPTRAQQPANTAIARPVDAGRVTLVEPGQADSAAFVPIGHVPVELLLGDDPRGALALGLSRDLPI